MLDFSIAELYLTGNDFHYGAFARDRDPLEVAFRISVRHEDAAACTVMLKEASGFALAMPPGFALFAGARPKPQAVVRLYSTLVDKSVPIVQVDDEPFAPAPSIVSKAPDRVIPDGPLMAADTEVPLVELAWLRSGDKGDKSNVGVIARRAEFMPYIWAALTKEAVRERFAHFVEGAVERWYLPGSESMNILMDEALGGGGMASLRNDSQGKSFGQILAIMPIPVPKALLGD